MREELPEANEDEAKAKQQAIAQSYVSMGNLAIARGDEAASQKGRRWATVDESVVFYERVCKGAEGGRHTFKCGCHGLHSQPTRT